jgi:hypothetical protein
VAYETRVSGFSVPFDGDVRSTQSQEGIFPVAGLSNEASHVIPPPEKFLEFPPRTAVLEKVYMPIRAGDKTGRGIAVFAENDADATPFVGCPLNFYLEISLRSEFLDTVSFGRRCHFSMRVR